MVDKKGILLIAGLFILSGLLGSGYTLRLVAPTRPPDYLSRRKPREESRKPVAPARPPDYTVSQPRSTTPARPPDYWVTPMVMNPKWTYKLGYGNCLRIPSYAFQGMLEEHDYNDIIETARRMGAKCIIVGDRVISVKTENIQYNNNIVPFKPSREIKYYVR